MATVQQGTDEESDQILRVICSTLVGERPMADTFGILDPAFVGLDVSDIQTVLTDYELEGIAVTDVNVSYRSESEQVTEVEWEPVVVEREPDVEGEEYE